MASITCMETIISSVLREANESIMSSCVLGPPIYNDNGSFEHPPGLSTLSGDRTRNFGKTYDHFTSNQLLQFDYPSPDHELDYGDLKEPVLDFSLSTVKNRNSSSLQRSPHYSYLGQGHAGLVVPPVAPASELENSVKEESSSWYNDVTNIVAAEYHCHVSRSSNNVTRDIVHNSGQPSHINNTVVKTEMPSDPQKVSPGAMVCEANRHFSDGSNVAYPHKTGKDLAASPAFNYGYSTIDSPVMNCSTDFPSKCADSAPGDLSCLWDSGFMDSNHMYGSTDSPSNHIQGRVLDMQDVFSSPNSVSSSGPLNDSSSRYDDSDFSDISNDQYNRRVPTGPHYHHDFSDIHAFASSRGQTLSASSSFSSLSPSSGSVSQSLLSTGTSQSPSQTMSENDHCGFQRRKDSETSNLAKMKHGKSPRGAQNLPPCRVCGNKASGLHFGVNTCEACNEFFRRSLKRGATYYCTKNRECQVYGRKRNACSYCRYHRCVDMGMSRNAIKTGRYSHKTRTEYAIEVEEYKLLESNRAETEKFEHLLNDLVKYHDKYVKVTTRVPEDELRSSQFAYLELFETQREHELRHPPLSSSMHNKRLAYDPRANKEDLSLTMHDVEMTEKWLRNYINFAKNVPGFKELALSDQASLVRGSWFEFWFLGAFRGYNKQLQVVIYPNKRCFHEEEIKKVFGEEYTTFSFCLGDRMRSLNVTPEEMVLIKTVCLTFPDRTPLVNKEAVDKMHWLMISCLLHKVEKNRPGDKKIFPLIVSKLVELRTLTDIAMRAHRRALFQDVLKDSPLLSEMVDTRTRYVQGTFQKSTEYSTTTE